MKAHPEKLKKFQLPRSYTIDCIEIDVIGNETRKYANNEKKRLKVVASQQTNPKLETDVGQTESNSTTNKHKWFFSFIFTMLVVSIAVLIVALVKKRDNVCSSFACIRTAALSLQYMDSTVDPCNNFYNFACGHYGTDLNQTEPNTNVFNKAEILVENQLKFIAAEPLPKDAPKFLIRLFKMYEMCNKNHVNTKDEINYLKLSLMRQLDGWPMVVGDMWKETHNFTEFIHALRLWGFPYNHFFKVGVNIDTDNHPRYRLVVSSIDPYTPSDFEQKVEYLAKLLGGNETVIQRDLKQLMLFKSGLEKVIKKTRPINTIITIKGLQTVIPIFNWLSYFTRIVSLEKVKVADDTVIRLLFRGMTDLIQFILDTPKRTLINYIFSKIVLFSAESLPYLEIPYFRYNSIKTISNMRERIPVAMNFLYVKKYFNEDIKNAVQEILSDIKVKFIESLKSVEWLDKSSRKLSLETINSTNFIIGYPKQLLDLTILDSYYRPLEIENGSCLQALNKASKFNADNLFKKLAMPVVNDWEFLEINVTSNYVYYNRVYNYLFVPAAFIVNMMYDKQHPNYVNFATLGYAVGYQLTLAFRKQKRKWLPETRKKYKETIQCIDNQYRNFTAFKINFTLSKNVADNIGLKQAYNAYQLWLKRNSNEQKLPGLNFSDNQMFWISFAQLWCEQTTELEDISVYDRQAPGRFRVLGTVNNAETFSKDFKCPVGSPMNPHNKCTVL